MLFRISAVLAGVVLLGCEAPVDNTFVNGTASGVSFPNASAVSVTDKDILGFMRQTVWLGSGLRCSDLGKFEWNFGPDSRMQPDGGRQQTLIITNSSSAFLDTGKGLERMNGTTERFWLESEQGGTLRGRFVASFSALPDGGVLDAGVLSGDFIAAPCANASAGCSAAPGMFLLGALALLLTRRRSTGTSRRGRS
jgi:hypothetical protein